MLKNILKISFVVCCLLLVFGARAQMIEDPTTWTYEAKKLADNEYALVFHLELGEGWHIWSMEPGGDGFQIPPAFTFDANADVKIAGAPVEKGEKVTEEMEGVDGVVNYFSGKVDFIQKIKISGGGTITGTHEYQVCNDRICLPPKTKKFSFEISE